MFAGTKQLQLAAKALSFLGKGPEFEPHCLLCSVEAPVSKASQAAGRR